MNSQVPIVFIHGFKGARLINKENKIVWITPLQVLALHTPAIGLPLIWNNNVQEKDGLSVHAAQDDVSVIPGLYRISPYGVLLKAMASWEQPFYSFVYDWRRSNFETLNLFEKFIESIKQKHGSKVKVIAHSNGGMLTLALLNQRPDLFESIVFIGVPFRGGIGFLPDLQVVRAFGLNKRILSPAVLGSMTPVYTSFPLTGHGALDKNGVPHLTDYFSVQTWQKNQWGLFKTSKESKEKIEKFMIEALKQAKEFRELMVSKNISYPPIKVVLSKTRPTLFAIKALDKGWDLNALKKPGDGRICEEDALPPEGIPYTKFYSNAEHSDLINDPKIMGWIR
ncbi:MAG: alpha/beta hydrolase [Oligoflexia bacterium]|nr:alpha/beta hydrolase [Oligoflexia bacterium]